LDGAQSLKSNRWEEFMEHPFVTENNKERERLGNLVNRLSEEELNLSLDANWTVAMALGHLAFWDQWSLTLLRKSKASGIFAANVDSNTVNDTLLPIFSAMPPRQAASLALSSAREIDKELEQAPEDLIRKIEKSAQPWRLYRSKHRKLHLDEIAAVLQKSKAIRPVIKEIMDSADIRASAKVINTSFGHSISFWNKLDRLITSHQIVIDRPKGSHHPRFPELIYPLDYGYLQGTSSGDGQGIDVWQSSLDENRLVAVICTVDTLKQDTEVKLLIGCIDDEIDLVDWFYNSSEFMSGIIVRRGLI